MLTCLTLRLASLKFFSCPDGSPNKLQFVAGSRNGSTKTNDKRSFRQANEVCRTFQRIYMNELFSLTRDGEIAIITVNNPQ